MYGKNRLTSILLIVLYFTRIVNRLKREGIWIEQCWRDVLKITWELEDKEDIFEKQLRPRIPIRVAFSCCQQFILSKEMVHKRPLIVWKKLLHIINEQDVCHEGEPEYQNLYSYVYNNLKAGPEPQLISTEHDTENYGRHTQGGAMEHLAHVIFGGKNLEMKFPTLRDVCTHYEEDCPFSPCYMGKL